MAEKKELACTSLSEVLSTIFPSNPPFRTKYPAKWKIGFLLKSRIRLGFYQSKCRFQEKHHKKILLIALDSTSQWPKRTPMVPETHRYSSQKIPKFSKNHIKIPKIGPIGAPMGPPWGPMGAHGPPWAPMGPPGAPPPPAAAPNQPFSAIGKNIFQKK